MSMPARPSSPPRAALYYPFHLCHPRTLDALLAQYEAAHFRDFMALRLTRFAGLTAYADRMGDGREELVRSGRLVQGYNVSGPLDAALETAVDRDLADGAWRALFHDGLREDRRFQRGLFDLSHAVILAGRSLPGPAVLLRLLEAHRQTDAWTVARVRTLGSPTDTEQALDAEYGLAAVKTSAALHYTVRLAREHHLIPVTDSPVHRALFDRMLDRAGLAMDHAYIARDGY
jgi:hypothetical protein